MRISIESTNSISIDSDSPDHRCKVLWFSCLLNIVDLTSYQLYAFTIPIRAQYSCFRIHSRLDSVHCIQLHAYSIETEGLMWIPT